MRKRIVTLVMLSLAIMAASSAQQAFFDRIRERGKVVFITQADDRRPFLYRVGDAWDGMEMPYIECIARTIGVPWSVVVQPDHGECLRMLDEGEADVFVGGRRITTADAMFLGFSEPFASLETCLVVNRLRGASLQKRADQSLLDAFRNAEAVRVGAMARSSQWAFEPEFKPEITDRYESYSPMIRDLEDGLIDACVMDSAEYDAFLMGRAERLLFFRPLRLEYTESVGFAVSWKDVESLPFISIAIRSTVSGDDWRKSDE